MTQAPLIIRGHNPDVLTCIANLSNDEVFTPPEMASAMLDLIAEAWAEANDGANIWADSTVTFLDPFVKSGVFLREITRRLTDGLVTEIPDLQERVNHILTKQVFGIGITELTALLARRSVYCSKHANGKHSIAKSFTTEDGNIWFERTEHTWAGGTPEIRYDPVTSEESKVYINRRCAYCGANERDYQRGDELETHAYALIHTDDPHALIHQLFGAHMQFDVIIGNPPYQLSDGGQGASALPIYQKFVEQAKELDPRFLTMVIPARWLFGGRGLEGFRQEMLQDKRLRCLVDFPDSRQAFDSVDVAGGICYFLWDRDNPGDCRVITYDHHGGRTASTRPLLEPGAEVFIRNASALSILRKVVARESGLDGIILSPAQRFELQVSGQKPFGLRTYFRGTSQPTTPADLAVLQAGGMGWTRREEINEGVDFIDKWKVFTSKSSSEHAGQADKNGMRRVLSLTGLLPPGWVCTETYVLLGAFDSEVEARYCLSYATTKFFRFLVAARTSAQDLPRAAYSFVPKLDYSRAWSDADLYMRYQLTPEEIAMIESFIRPMEGKTYG